jgi:hypothetical protein
MEYWVQILLSPQNETSGHYYIGQRIRCSSK